MSLLHAFLGASLNNRNLSAARSDAAILRTTLGTENKNLLQNKASNKVANGISFTVHADGSVTATGTATADAYLTLNSAIPLVKGHRYLLNGCPDGGGNTRYQLYLVGAHNEAGYCTSSKAVAIYATQSGNAAAYIKIAAGQTVDLTFFPMLRDSEIQDNSYQPYAPSLDARIAALEALVNGAAVMSLDDMEESDDPAEEPALHCPVAPAAVIVVYDPEEAMIYE
ncbi:MAG: hypothetical protein IKM30_03885 [Oscillospiraceae bacterium]|nr:hypothetical protein [Oscillospiraceae bacterium]